MLVSIVLDRPLDEAKALVEDPDRLISEITAILESKQGHPLLNQMVNPDVRDDMPIADFTAASSSRGFGPHEDPHKQKYHKIGFSSVMLAAAITNVGDPRLVIPVHIAHAPWLVRFLSVTLETHGWFISPPLPPPKKKNQGQHGRPRAGLLYCANASYAQDGFPPRPSVGSVVFLFFCWGWGSSFVSGCDGSGLGRCQSTSRHGTCRCYAQSAR